MEYLSNNKGLDSTGRLQLSTIEVWQLAPQKAPSSQNESTLPTIIFLGGYPPWNKHIWKSIVGRCISFLIWPILRGELLVSGIYSSNHHVLGVELWIFSMTEGSAVAPRVGTHPPGALTAKKIPPVFYAHLSHDARCPERTCWKAGKIWDDMMTRHLRWYRMSCMMRFWRPWFPDLRLHTSFCSFILQSVSIIYMWTIHVWYMY